MRTVLIVAGRYLPGFRDGGPVRSIINLTEWLGDEYDIRIVCHDRDHGDDRPYPCIKYDGYNTVGKAGVWYVSEYTPQVIEKLAEDADVVYVGGLYDDYARYTMKLKRDGSIKAPVYVAPMGSFSPEAFKIKGLKKKLFIRYMNMTGLFDKITWSVTSGREEQELRSVLGERARCVVASDLPRRGTTQHTGSKEQDVLKLVFMSRIARKKNLAIIPDILKLLADDIRVKVDIYGTPEDRGYLHDCMAKFDELRRTHPDCRWEYMGEADSEKVPEIFAGYDAFLFPTLGENYGHVIAESLSAGCIPVISDTTPWLDLDEAGCGYVCKLGDKAAFAEVLTDLARMGEAQMASKRDKCYEYIISVNERSVKDSGYRKIFG